MTPKPEERELLPCPFANCGGKGVHDYAGWPFHSCVCCDNPECRLYNAGMTAEQWNSRTPAPPSLAVGEAIEKIKAVENFVAGICVVRGYGHAELGYLQQIHAALIQAAQSPKGCGMTREEVHALIDSTWQKYSSEQIKAYQIVDAAGVVSSIIDALIAANLLTVKGE